MFLKVLTFLKELNDSFDLVNVCLIVKFLQQKFDSSLDHLCCVYLWVVTILSFDGHSGNHLLLLRLFNRLLWCLWRFRCDHLLRLLLFKVSSVVFVAYDTHLIQLFVSHQRNAALYHICWWNFNYYHHKRTLALSSLSIVTHPIVKLDSLDKYHPWGSFILPLLSIFGAHTLVIHDF